MSSHFANHVRESVIGPSAEGTSLHEMQALKYLACAVIQRAVDDADGKCARWDDQQDAKQFLCNVDGWLTPWCVLAGVRLDAVVEYALRRGYNHGESHPTQATGAPEVQDAPQARRRTHPIKQGGAPRSSGDSQALGPEVVNPCAGCGRPMINLRGQLLCMNVQCDVVGL